MIMLFSNYRERKGEFCVGLFASSRSLIALRRNTLYIIPKKLVNMPDDEIYNERFHIMALPPFCQQNFKIGLRRRPRRSGMLQVMGYWVRYNVFDGKQDFIL